METLPVVDLAPYLSDPTTAEAKAACEKIAEILKATSCLIVKDPRVPEEKNTTFLNLLERYYDQPLDKKMKDVHPEISYQLGATPEFTEIPRDHTKVIESLDVNNKPHVPKGADCKWRYFWRIGPRPENSKFPELNAPPVIPEGFPEWVDVMNEWGGLMLATVQTVAEMAAIGFGLPKNTFIDLLRNGPHLLAPTGSDLGKYGKVGTILAGFHYDLNFLTIHGKSRFPGLFIWLRDGRRIPVRVPDGCLLLQAGKQFEWVTGGAVTAGFHEVVVTEDTLRAVERASAEKRPLWRVSSTLFSHVASDNTLAPLDKFANEENKAKYPPTLAGQQVRDELAAIKLGLATSYGPM